MGRRMKGNILEAYIALAKAWSFLETEARFVSREKQVTIGKILRSIEDTQKEVYDIAETYENDPAYKEP